LDFLPTLRGGEEFPRRNVSPGATFRMGTYATSCVEPRGNIFVAWADLLEGVSRIYYRRSSNGGNSWEGPLSGQPLLTNNRTSKLNHHEFHPQLISIPGGEIGCAFNDYSPKGRAEFPKSLVDVDLAISIDNGQTFSERITVTDYLWDPTVNAQNSNKDPKVTFIGEYFGLDPSLLGFFRCGLIPVQACKKFSCQE
jgi:hypothetical protein